MLFLDCISPSVMLPENRLAVLLQKVKQNQIDSCLWHTNASPPSLYSDHFCDRSQFPTETALQLTDQQGEVWGIQFSHDGRRLAGFGSDEVVTIWDVPSFNVVQTLGDHVDGVANVSWSPDDSMIVTCARDRYARLWNAKTGVLLRRLDRFGEPVSGCVWAPNGRSFTVSSLDKQHGMRTYTTDGDMICDWAKEHRVQDLCSSPDGRWIVSVDDRSTIHVYNATTRGLEFEIEMKARPTSVSISEDSSRLLVNRQDGEAQLIDLATRSVTQKFLGHTGGECLIRSAFGGANESFVVSGSEGWFLPSFLLSFLPIFPARSSCRSCRPSSCYSLYSFSFFYYSFYPSFLLFSSFSFSLLISRLNRRKRPNLA